MSNKNIKAFTLVELSIVIVIIGLMIAGVSAGQAIVASSKITAQANDLQKYSSAFNAFMMQYNAVPGDMSNANLYWTGATVGNGDGKLNFDDDVANLNIESIAFFEHLSLAQLIPESFRSSSKLINQSFPALKTNNTKGMVAAGYLRSNALSFYQVPITGTQRYTAELNLCIGSTGSVANSFYNDSAAVFTPKEAYALDTKIDDGLARSGLFKSYQQNKALAGLCLTANDSNSYLVTNSGISCDSEYILKK